MQIKRFFSTEEVKNTCGYIDSQKKYEIIRTVVYFGISLSLFFAGYITTKSKMNLLTVVAVLGCLPASKSLVSAIMFMRFKSTDRELCRLLDKLWVGNDVLYDLVFTTEKVNYEISHAVYRAKCLALFTLDKAIDAKALEAHILEYMKRAGIHGVTVKVFHGMKSYSERLEQMAVLEDDDTRLAEEVRNLLKEITL